MYEIDGICYAGNPGDAPEASVRVVAALPFSGSMMLLTCQSGEKRLFDAACLVGWGSAFEPLHDNSVLCNPKIAHGVVTWAGETIDIAPEYMLEHSVPYDDGNDALLAV